MLKWLKQFFTEPMTEARLVQFKNKTTHKPLLQLIDRIATLHPLEAPSELPNFIQAVNRLSTVQTQIAAINASLGSAEQQSLLSGLIVQRNSLQTAITELLETFKKEDRSFYLLQSFLDSRQGEFSWRGIQLQDFREKLVSFGFDNVDAEFLWQVLRSFDPNLLPISSALFAKVLAKGNAVFMLHELRHLANAWLWWEQIVKQTNNVITIDQFRSICEELEWLGPELRMTFADFVGVDHSAVQGLQLSEFRQLFEMALAQLKRGALESAQAHLQALDALSSNPECKQAPDYANKVAALKRVFAGEHE